MVHGKNIFVDGDSLSCSKVNQVNDRIRGEDLVQLSLRPLAAVHEILATWDGWNTNSRWKCQWSHSQRHSLHKDVCFCIGVGPWLGYCLSWLCGICALQYHARRAPSIGNVWCCVATTIVMNQHHCNQGEGSNTSCSTISHHFSSCLSGLCQHFRFHRCTQQEPSCKDGLSLFDLQARHRTGAELVEKILGLWWVRFQGTLVV